MNMSEDDQNQAPGDSGEDGSNGDEAQRPVNGEDLAAKLAKTEEQLLYLQAEFENTKIRLRKEQEKAIRFSNEQIVRDLLPVADVLERALAAAEHLRTKGDSEVRNFVEGVALTQRELTQVLSRYGVEFVGEVGAKFDPNLHEAVSQRDAAAEQHDTVLDIVQRGCLLHGRLIKPARVVVGKSAAAN